MDRPQEPSRAPLQAPIRWPLLTIFLTGFALLAAGMLTTPDVTLQPRLLLVAFLVLLLLGWIIAVRLRERWWPGLQSLLEDHTDALDTLPDRHIGWWIGLASGAALFVELVLIRWQASAFQLFAYYKNVSLLAAFLGLGIGYAYGRRRLVCTPLVLPAVSLHFVLLSSLRSSSLQDLLQNPVSETLTLGMRTANEWSQACVSYGFLILVFTCTVLTCIPLGHLASRLMQRRAPLVAYSANLLGSLAGIGLFTLLGSIWSPPIVWLLGCLLALMPFLLLRQAGMLALPGRSTITMAGPSLVASSAAVAFLALPLHPDQVDVYSPYQILSLQVHRGELPSLKVNQVYFQRILDLSPKARQADPNVEKVAAYYELPYQLKPQPERVLVVGAGTGNDVAAGLRQQAGHIDAVEIDPAILQYGKKLHPERPYQDSRVVPIVQDARTFLRHTDQQYDLVVYGLLDSHTLLSGRSGVRLDSFVYTVEGFRDARARLAPRGMVAMTFCLLNKPQGRKFFLMLKEAFDGQEPRVFQTRYDEGHMFVIGPGMPKGALDLPVQEVTEVFRDETTAADVSTDDWPFLYMPVRKYPGSYLIMAGMLLGVALLTVYQLLPLREGFSPACFFLGAGFMLIETQGITELGLLFGNTWQVISVVIAGILIMAFLANLVCHRLGALHPILAYGLLLGALWLGLAVTPGSLSGLPPYASKLLATGLITLPLFFSGFAFSGELKRQANVSAALSSNLLGAMVGGFCEYNSMYFGFRSLSVLAMVLYGLAFAATLAFMVARLFTRKDRPAEPPAEELARVA
jgi:hypothetical protein